MRRGSVVKYSTAALFRLLRRLRCKFDVANWPTVPRLRPVHISLEAIRMIFSRRTMKITHMLACMHMLLFYSTVDFGDKNQATIA